jgi:hypothetical protein
LLESKVLKSFIRLTLICRDTTLIPYLINCN